MVEFLLYFSFVLTRAYVQVVGSGLLNHQKTFTKAQPFLEAAKL